MSCDVRAGGRAEKRDAEKDESENEAFTFRTWLVRLGLNGDEYKTTRELLLENLEGNRAWRNGKPSGVKRKKRGEAAR